MAAEPAKKEEKKEAKKEEKKSERGVIMGLFLFFLTFGVLPCVVMGGAILLAYLLSGGQITWHGI